MSKKKKKEDETIIYDLSTEKDNSKEYTDLFFKAKTFNSNRQEAYAENMAFYQGNQHLLKKYKNETPWVVNMNTPYATVAIDNRVSSLLANDYIGELLPLTEEDVEPVEALSQTYIREWRRLKLDSVVNSCIRGSSVVREFYCHIVLNSKKTVGSESKKTLGMIEAYAIEPARVFIDPTARCLKDANYMFVAGRIAKEEACKKYPKIKALKSSMDSHTPEDRGEVYYDNDYVTEQDNIYTTLTMYKKKDGKILRVKMVNDIIVDEKMMPLKNFPVHQMRWKKAAQSCYGLSLMDEVLCLQKAITSIESAITNTAMSYAAPSMMVRKGCGVDPSIVAKANGAPGVVYAVEGNLDNAIRPVIPPRIQQEILSIKTDFQNQIDKITGNSNQFLGDIGTAGNTSGGAKVAVDRAKIIEVDILNNIGEFISDITDTLVEYITGAYGGETLSYFDGRDGDNKPKFSTIKLPEKKVLEKSQYQYYIELETKTPYSRERQKELLLEIYQLERQYDTPVKTVTVSDIIKNTDLENRTEIISRFNRLSFQDSQTKTDAIKQMFDTGANFGIDENLIKDAVAEIIDNRRETPAVDQVMQIAEQAFQQEIQANQQKLAAVNEQLMATPQQQMNVQQMAQQIQQQPTQPPMGNLQGLQQMM